MSEILCRANKINLVYKKSTYRSISLRDTFISCFKHPIETLLRPADRVHILKDISFEIRNGDRIGLLGVNGAGKTSLCRILSGVMRPTQGFIQRAPNTRAIFQSQIVLYPDLTGWENAQLLLSLMFPALTRSECKTLTTQACEFSELGQALFTPFRTYSNGMQTRLLLSIATVSPADLLILDEVFDGADIFWQKKIAERTKTIIDKSGALIFVSHNMNLMASLCRSALVIKDGHLKHFATFEAGRKYYES